MMDDIQNGQAPVAQDAEEQNAPVAVPAQDEQAEETEGEQEAAA